MKFANLRKNGPLQNGLATKWVLPERATTKQAAPKRCASNEF